MIDGTRRATPGCMKSELDTFYQLVDKIEIAMMTTRRCDGHLRSRPMATQKRRAGADLWFVTEKGSAKTVDISHHSQVNLAYFRQSSMEWISVSGVARLTDDREKIRQLYAPDWKMWFPDQGDPRHGTPEDPRFELIAVDIHFADFLEITKPKPVVLFELAKGWMTGETPDVGEMHRIER
jgi:general stress protein 26